MRHFIVWFTLALLVLALLGSLAWLFHDWFAPGFDFEPAITALALLAAITGLFIERVLAVRERRRELLRSVVFELHKSYNLLNDSLFAPSEGDESTRPAVYPRIQQTALDAAIASDQ